MKTVVAYTLAPWEHSLAVLRVSGPVQQAGLELVWGNHYDDINPEKASQADIIVIQRDFPRYGQACRDILNRARLQGKPVVVDLDDLLLKLPDDHPDRGTHYYSGALFPLLQSLIEADAITASTQPLCEYLRQFNPNTWLLPNYLNDRIWKMQEPAPEAKTGTDPVIIAYIGGDSHLPDLEMITPVLLTILSTYKERIVLRFHGGRPPEALLGPSNVEWFPLNIPDYAAFAGYVQSQQCDIFIAPLADNLFNTCKSPIKYMEYSAMGVPGVYSRIPPYTHLITHGENGFLAKTGEEWMQGIVNLIENPEIRRRMGLATQTDVRKHWLLRDHAHEWAETYEKIAATKLPAGPVHTVPARLIVELTQQTQDWQESLLAQLVDKNREVADLQANLIEKERSINALSEQLTALRSGFTGKLNLGIKWISSRLKNI